MNPFKMPLDVIPFGIFIEYVGYSGWFLYKLHRIKIFPVKPPNDLFFVVFFVVEKYEFDIKCLIA